MIHEKQIHILVGCADARDLSQIHLDAIQHTTEEFQKNGIDIEFHTIRAAGSFISPDVVMDIKRIFEQAQRNLQTDIPTQYYVHIQTHGHLTEDSKEDYISHVHDLHIVEGSPLNCGMLHASVVGVEIEKFLIEEKLTVQLNGRIVQIKNDTDIKELLQAVYAYEGYLAGDWIKSIDLLRTHPRHQRTQLEKVIINDPELKMLGIKITCGIQDYGIHALIRVDDGVPAVAFWDTVHQSIRKQVTNDRRNKDMLIMQSQKQKPLAGLLSMADEQQTMRSLAAQYYMDENGIAYDSGYLPNTIFNMTGTSFDIPNTPFGAYVIAGFFYGVKHLHLTTQMVMGNTDDQTQRMIRKLKNDPIMNLITTKFNVKIIPINQQVLMKRYL